MLPFDLKLESGPLPENAWQRQMTMSQYLGSSSISVEDRGHNHGLQFALAIERRMSRQGGRCQQ
jgi:hypothetical protein